MNKKPCQNVSISTLEKTLPIDSSTYYSYSICYYIDKSYSQVWRSIRDHHVLRIQKQKINHPFFFLHQQNKNLSLFLQTNTILFYLRQKIGHPRRLNLAIILTRLYLIR